MPSRHVDDSLVESLVDDSLVESLVDDSLVESLVDDSLVESLVDDSLLGRSCHVQGMRSSEMLAMLVSRSKMLYQMWSVLS